MKKILNTSMVYFVLAIAAGVFHREYTKFSGFIGKTVLGNVHTHLLVMGAFLFLIVALFCIQLPGLLDARIFRRFYVLYNIALPFMAVTMLARGMIQVKNAELTKAVDASLSGMAGIAHILITIALVMLFMALKKNVISNDRKQAG